MLAGVLAVLLLLPPDPVYYPTVIVPVRAIEKLEPDSVVKWRDRIRYVIPSPVQVATAPDAAAGLVGSFCAPTVLRVSGDTARAAEAPRTLLLRSGSLDRGWFMRPDELRLTGPTSDDDLVQATFRTHGSAGFRVVGDSVLVRYDRWWWVREGGERALWLGLGYLIGGR